MENIKNIIGIINQETSVLRSNNRFNRGVVKLEMNDFKALIKAEAENILAKRGRIIDFSIDKDNEQVIEYLNLYLGYDNSFPGDLSKGIMIIGSIGCGKTLIMLAFFNIIERFTIKRITKAHSKGLARMFHENGMSYYEKKPLFIDDIGKETKEVKDFGTIINPIPDLISLRYDFGAWTFATCNYKTSELNDFYGTMITDRFKEIFNILTLEGNSRRK
jgi:DNA replication protein DnaC